MPLPLQDSPCKKPLPADFAEMAGRPMTAQQLMAHYKVGDHVIRRWKRESGAGILKPRRNSGWPDNMAELCAEYGIRDIARITGMSPDTLRVKLKRDFPDLHALAVTNGFAKRTANALEVGKKGGQVWKQMVRSGQAKPAQFRLPNTRVTVGELQVEAKTKADKAMRWLQRYGVCYPMRVHDPRLTDYIFKGNRMDAAAIIAEAESRGWRVDGWKDVA